MCVMVSSTVPVVQQVPVADVVAVAADAGREIPLES